MEHDRQKRISRRQEVLSRFGNNFSKMYYEGNMLTHMVVDWLSNDVSPEQILEQLIVKDSERQKIMEDLIAKMPAPPILVSKEKYEEIEKTFVDTPKGKMWFDVDAWQNEKKWMEDKMNGKK